MYFIYKKIFRQSLYEIKKYLTAVISVMLETSNNTKDKVNNKSIVKCGITFF